MTLDPCPYCLSETMQRRPNNFGGDHFECLDCGYVTEIRDELPNAVRPPAPDSPLDCGYVREVKRKSKSEAA